VVGRPLPGNRNDCGFARAQIIHGTTLSTRRSRPSPRESWGLGGSSS
jgi:hypothetical protein